MFSSYQRCLEHMEQGPLYSWLILNYYQSSYIKIALVMYEVILIVYMNWNGESEPEGSDAEGV